MYAGIAFAFTDILPAALTLLTRRETINDPLDIVVMLWLRIVPPTLIFAIPFTIWHPNLCTVVLIAHVYGIEVLATLPRQERVCSTFGFVIRQVV